MKRLLVPGCAAHGWDVAQREPKQACVSFEVSQLGPISAPLENGRYGHYSLRELRVARNRVTDGTGGSEQLS
jgi:hypothetical protein